MDEEKVSPLAALVSAAASGEPLTSEARDRLRLELIDRAMSSKVRPLTWAQLGMMLGYPSGREAKKAVHGLRERVKHAQIAAEAASGGD